MALVAHALSDMNLAYPALNVPSLIAIGTLVSHKIDRLI